MNSIHDALDKAIQNAEQQEALKHQKNIFLDQVLTLKGKSRQLDLDLMRERRVVSLDNSTVESEAFRLLRTKVLKQMRENNWTSFAVTAPTQGVGKTTVSVNLAIAMALDMNQSILLVDLDMKFPKVHWYFGLENESGLRDYFLSDKPLSEILINPSIDRLTILPGRGQAIGSAELLTGPKMKTLMNEVGRGSQSRIVIFDMPPVLQTDDVIATLDYYDAILMVVEEGKTKPDELKKTMKLLAKKPLIGTVLNKSQTPPEHKGYY